MLGGTRFFGRRLVHSLLSEGHRVTVGSRGLTQDDFGQSVTRLRVDRQNPESLRQATLGQRYDVVYDQICYNPREAKAALEALGDRVGRYIYTSSQAVYEHQESPQVERDFLPEGYVLDLGAESYAYDEGKRQAETYFFRHAPFPVVAARVALVLSGTDDYTGRFDFHVSHIAAGRSIGVTVGDQPLTFISAQDTADFLRFIGTESDFAGPINVGSPDFMDAREISGQIGAHLGRSAKFHAAAENDPDRSPYSVQKALRLSMELATGIGFRFEEIGPQLPSMVDSSMAKLGLS